jgi:hypothetical protein
MIAVSKYAMQLDAYTKHFPREHIQLLALEDMKRDPQRTLESACRFLEIDSDFQFEGLDVLRNPSLRDHAVYTALGKVPLLPAIVKRTIPIRHRRALRNRMGRELKADTRLSEGKREAVLAELRDDVRRLRDEYGFDVSRWNLPGV